MSDDYRSEIDIEDTYNRLWITLNQLILTEEDYAYLDILFERIRAYHFDINVSIPTQYYGPIRWRDHTAKYIAAIQELRLTPRCEYIVRKNAAQMLNLSRFEIESLGLDVDNDPIKKVPKLFLLSQLLDSALPKKNYFEMLPYEWDAALPQDWLFDISKKVPKVPIGYDTLASTTVWGYPEGFLFGIPVTCCFEVYTELFRLRR